MWSTSLHYVSALERLLQLGALLENTVQKNSRSNSSMGEKTGCKAVGQRPFFYPVPFFYSPPAFSTVPCQPCPWKDPVRCALDHLPCNVSRCLYEISYSEHEAMTNKNTHTVQTSAKARITPTQTQEVAVWCSGNALVLINAVALHRARLVLGWVTAFG